MPIKQHIQKHRYIPLILLLRKSISLHGSHCRLFSNIWLCLNLLISYLMVAVFIEI